MYFGCLLSYVHVFVNVSFRNICMYGYTDHATVPQSFKFLIRTYISGIYKRIFMHVAMVHTCIRIYVYSFYSNYYKATSNYNSL